MTSMYGVPPFLYRLLSRVHLVSYSNFETRENPVFHIQHAQPPGIDIIIIRIKYASIKIYYLYCTCEISKNKIQFFLSLYGHVRHTTTCMQKFATGRSLYRHYKSEWRNFNIKLLPNNTRRTQSRLIIKGSGEAKEKPFNNKYTGEKNQNKNKNDYILFY